MGFVDQLMEKIQVDQWAARVAATLGPPASGAKLDRDAARSLLSRASFSRHDERGMELYVRDSGEGQDVLVLDNELPLYRGTDVADVVVRKNPYIREMFKPKNFVRILWDKDARITRRQETGQALHSLALAGLDLSFGPEDVERIRLETAASLSAARPGEVSQGLALFAELLGWAAPPVALPDPEVEARGVFAKDPEGRILGGPLVLYHKGKNRLAWFSGPAPLSSREDRARLAARAKGGEPVDQQGEKALQKLKETVLERYHLAPGGRAVLGEV
ncbi:MAG: hypothetical protein KKA60_10235 [Proteobacteria bacterium]|nr:hypothetical protein [Pseudomonadota bacterium]